MRRTIRSRVAVWHKPIAYAVRSSYRYAMQELVDLKRMTLPEKLRLMEALWEDLCQSEQELSSPDWHREVLEEREKKIASGEESFVDWDVAKKKLRQELS